MVTKKNDNKMNQIIKYLFVGLLPILLLSCYKDNTSIGTNQITELKISFPNVTGSEVNMEKNEPLTIDPVITQDGADKPMTYEWQVNYEVYSTDKKLVYPCSKLGKYFIRLKVSNEDGSAFKSFNLNVNSPYEEGLMVLGQNEQGDGTLAFMRKYSPAEIAAGKVESFVNNVFTLNNPGNKIGKNPTDIAKRLNQVFISSSGEGKIYYLNAKTFELEATISASDYPDFKPVAMNVPDAGFRTAVILCEGGKIYNLALLENLILSNVKYSQTVMMKTGFGFNLNDCFNYYWNPATSQMLQYSSYYTTNSLQAFQNQDLVDFFYDDASSIYVITKSRTTPTVYTKTVFSQYIQNNSTKLLDIKEQAVLNVIGGDPVLTPSSPIVVNAIFKKLIYASGNKLYSWFYTGTSMPTTPFATVDEGTITSVEQSVDGSLLYVGVYNPAASGLKGNVYVFNMDNGNLIKKYTGVSDKPVKLFYKKK